MSLRPDDPDGWVEQHEALVAWHAESFDVDVDDPWPDPDPGEPADVEAPLWEVTDDDAANWALRKIARAEAELRRLSDAATHEKAAIDAWLADASRGPRHTVEFFTGRLIAYRRRLEDDNADLPATYKLPGGDLTRRAGRPTADVVDPDEFMAWALVNEPDAVKLSPLTTPVTRSDRYAVTETGVVVETATGEVVPGLVVRATPPRYGVKAR